QAIVKNGTLVKEFVLMGFTVGAEVQMVLFFIFLTLYLITMGGNLGMIFLIQRDPRLQTPMYFFLSHLSFLDVCYSSVIIPQMLETLKSGRAPITYERCATQFFFFTLCASTECFLLAVMAYDRYVAVCNPLLYVTAMTPQTRLGLVMGAYSGAMVNTVIRAYSGGLSGAILRTVCTFTLSFCGPNQINFFFCDLPPLLELSCSDSPTSQILILFYGSFVIFVNALVILVSYLFIIRAILHVKSVGGRAKTFSTCASHLTVVMLFFGTLTFMYMSSNSNKSLEEDKVVSVFYTVIIPMLNPLIYSLRNKEVKAAFRKVISKLQVSQKIGKQA
uniref:Olfactory receptor n=1 Tax=Vombatus ursinus TaxID=29139 RepID=A0A4X2KFA6_VOMUR